jgi:hypothetical protein
MVAAYLPEKKRPLTPDEMVHFEQRIAVLRLNHPQGNLPQGCIIS